MFIDLSYCIACLYLMYVHTLMVLFFFLMLRPPPASTRTHTRCPYTALCRSHVHQALDARLDLDERAVIGDVGDLAEHAGVGRVAARSPTDRKSPRLNSSH